MAEISWISERGLSKFLAQNKLITRHKSQSMTLQSIQFWLKDTLKVLQGREVQLDGFLTLRKVSTLTGNLVSHIFK